MLIRAFAGVFSCSNAVHPLRQTPINTPRDPIAVGHLTLGLVMPKASLVRARGPNGRSRWPMMSRECPGSAAHCVGDELQDLLDHRKSGDPAGGCPCEVHVLETATNGR